MKKAPRVFHKYHWMFKVSKKEGAEFLFDWLTVRDAHYRARSLSVDNKCFVSVFRQFGGVRVIHEWFDCHR